VRRSLRRRAVGAVGAPCLLSAMRCSQAGGGHGPEARLSIKRDKAHVLFGGTKMLQHTGNPDARIRTPDGGCLAVVLRTGFETAQGVRGAVCPLFKKGRQK
jgi:magnesium-transporting ATPase (P-type)